MEVWPGGAASLADCPNPVALPNGIPRFHVNARQMKKCAVQPHAMVNHYQFAFKREWLVGRKHDDPLCRGDNRCSSCTGKIHSAMGGSRFAAIDALSPEVAGDPARDRPDEALPPSHSVCHGHSGAFDLFELGRATRQELGIRCRPTAHPGDCLDKPASRGNLEGFRYDVAICQYCGQLRDFAMIPAKTSNKAAILRKWYLLPVHRQPDRTRRNDSTDQSALTRLAIEQKWPPALIGRPCFDRSGHSHCRNKAGR